MKIGLFGGTFNPIHSGHIATAGFVLNEFKLDLIYFIPAYQTAYKQFGSNASYRKKMIRLALKNNKNFKLNLIELKNKGISYTCDTVKNLYNKKDRFYLILGDEWLTEFNKWNNFQDIFKYAKLIIVNRTSKKSHLVRPLEKYKTEILFSKNPVIDISSSLIREFIQKEKDIKDMVPEKVYEYIKKHELYTKE